MDRCIGLPTPEATRIDGRLTVTALRWPCGTVSEPDHDVCPVHLGRMHEQESPLSLALQVLALAAGLYVVLYFIA